MALTGVDTRPNKCSYRCKLDLVLTLVQVIVWSAQQVRLAPISIEGKIDSLRVRVSRPFGSYGHELSIKSRSGTTVRYSITAFFWPCVYTCDLSWAPVIMKMINYFPDKRAQPQTLIEHPIFKNDDLTEAVNNRGHHVPRFWSKKISPNYSTEITWEHIRLALCTS